MFRNKKLSIEGGAGKEMDKSCLNSINKLPNILEPTTKFELFFSGIAPQNVSLCEISTIGFFLVFSKIEEKYSKLNVHLHFLNQKNNFICVFLSCFGLY